LPEPTNGGAESSAAAEEPSSVVIEPSNPAATTAPEAGETEAPVATQPSTPEEGDDEDCDSEEAGNAPTEVSTQAPKATRTRKGTRPTRGPRPSGYPWANNGSTCSTKTVTKTVYVTATPAARRF
ncbi:MUC1 Extracellular alpha-14-glucan glucosidase, partial [Fusarium albosuccineum]